MTILDIENLNPADLVLQYVVECRGQGHFLPYTDHLIIQEWLSCTAHPDQLLVVLSEILPSFFEKDRLAQRPPRSLSAVRLKVQRKLKDRAMCDAGTG